MTGFVITCILEYTYLAQLQTNELNNIGVVWAGGATRARTIATTQTTSRATSTTTVTTQNATYSTKVGEACG